MENKDMFHTNSTVPSRNIIGSLDENETTRYGWKSVETPWDIIGKYFDKGYLQRLVEHQIETFDNFTNIQIEKTINMFNPVEIYSDNDLDKETGKHTLEVNIKF